MMPVLKNTLICIILFSGLSFSQQSFRVFPGMVTQTEPVIGMHPENPNLIFVSGKTINTANAFTSEGVYVSRDGGFTWSGTDTCKGAIIQNHGGSPQVMVDNTGRLLLTHIGVPTFIAGVYCHYSTDFGKTWSAAVTVSSQPPEDKGSATLDNTAGSPYYGRVYSAWVNLINPYVSFSYSTNNGLNWTAPKAVNSGPTAVCSGGYLRTGADGTLYLCWAGLSGGAPFREDFIGFAKSVNGGETWTVQQNAFNINGISGTLATKSNILVNGLPQLAVDKSNGPRKGWLYIVTAEINSAPAGTDPDIVLRYSSDGGTVWSNGIRVNRDAVNNGKIQYFPALDVDKDGGVNIIFYDDRSTSADSAEVWLARSTDGGSSWSEQVVSETRFKPKPIPGGKAGYQGDHISLISQGDRLFALWMDDHTGIYQIWMKILDLRTLRIEQGVSHPVSFKLSQNYPNPFNPETKIKYELGKSNFISIKIFDVLGHEVETLFHGYQAPGSFKSIWRLPGSASGVYFCEFICGNERQILKMIAVK